jgi:putative NAD(P)H nitroreductase
LDGGNGGRSMDAPSLNTSLPKFGHTTGIMTVTEAIQSRRSVPSFDSGAEISLSELVALMEQANLSPSSMNLQSWEFMICHTAEEKARLQRVSYNQKKISEASAAVIIFGDLNHHRNAKTIAEHNVPKGILPVEKVQGFIESAVGAYEGNSQKQRDEAFRGGSLWAMNFMLLAQEAGWVTAAMGGFVPEQLMTEFSLPENLVPVLVICIGKPNPEITLYGRAHRISVAEKLHPAQ